MIPMSDVGRSKNKLRMRGRCKRTMRRRGGKRMNGMTGKTITVEVGGTERTWL